MQQIPLEIQTDNYLPLVVNWRGSHDEIVPNVVWIIGLKYSLAEVKIDPATGVIQKLKVVLAGKAAVSSSDKHIDSYLSTQLGTPAFSTEPWGNDIWTIGSYIREDKEFELHLHENGLLLVFDKEKAASRVACGQVTFGLTQEGYLCAVEVTGLAEKDISKIKECLDIQRTC